MTALLSFRVPALLTVSAPPPLANGLRFVPFRLTVPLAALMRVLVPFVLIPALPLIVSAPLFCSVALFRNKPSVMLPVLVPASVSEPETPDGPLTVKLLATVTSTLAFRAPPERFRSPTDIAELIVAVPPAMLTARFGTLMVPPLASSVAVPSTTAPVPVDVVSGLNVMFSFPNVEVMLALTLMLRKAFSVSEASVPALLLIGSATVMSPDCALVPPAAVEIATLVPASSAALMVAVVMIEASLVLVKFGVPVTLASLPVACIVMSLGSSSHWPPRVLTLTFWMSSFAAEVSTNPPLPLLPSPCAESRPRALSAPARLPPSSTFATMLPPFVPSAVTWLLSASSMRCVARSTMRPPSLTALLALTTPALRTRAP